MDATIDAARLGRDHRYRDELARTLLSKCRNGADHVELRRTAAQVFPELSRDPGNRILASIVGRAATLRARELPRDTRDVTDARLDMTPTHPLPYPENYAELDEDSRRTIVGFCIRQLHAGRDGADALKSLLRRHGWPYSERTFYVGPWKAARIRALRRPDDD
ncbi:MAG TPA: hypothetical protein VF039_07055 [Longimicrobiales bacterium]